MIRGKYISFLANLLKFGCFRSKCSSVKYNATGRPYSLVILGSALLRTFWIKFFFFYHGSTAPVGQGLPILEISRSHSDSHTLGRTPLVEWSSRRRDLYLTTHNRQISIPPVGFEPAIAASERPQTHALDRAAKRIGYVQYLEMLNFYQISEFLYQILVFTTNTP
jgi:hypothetical protein